MSVARYSVFGRSTLILSVLCLLIPGCASITARPLPPKVQVEGISAYVVPGTAETRFRVRLDVQNPNSYDISVRAIEASVRIEDQPLATTTLPAPVVLAAGTGTKVDIEAQPDFAAFGKALERVFRSGVVRYQVSGYAVVQDSTRLNFEKRGEVSLRDFMGRVR